MKATFITEYEYEYYWVKFKGRVVIAEYRKNKDDVLPKCYIPGEILVHVVDVVPLKRIEDYNNENCG